MLKNFDGLDRRDRIHFTTVDGRIVKKPDAGVRRNDSFALQRIQQTEVTLFERPDSGHPPGNILFNMQPSPSVA
ncbi:MAG: hypothetical protein WBF04_18225 [Candidatus Sulfotelmatobacter sp.]